MGRLHNTFITCKIVCGAYNTDDTDKYFIIGNGQNDSNRSNVFTVSKNGAVAAAGSITSNGTVVSLQGHTHDYSKVVVDTVSTGNISVNSDTTTATLTKGCYKKGYTPIGVVGYSASGTASSAFAFSILHIDGSGSNVNVTYRLRNYSNSNTTNLNITFYILYVKD